jgi:hypothetical protein
MISHRQGNWRLSQLLGYVASAVVTLSGAISLVLLISRLPGHKETPAQLLRAAGALWICNLLVFRMLVLAPGRGWSASARFAPLPHRWRILISADGIGPRSSP